MFSKANEGCLDSQLTLQPSLQRCFRIHEVRVQPIEPPPILVVNTILQNFSLSKEAPDEFLTYNQQL